MSGILDAYANTQYRPVTTTETGQDDPLSVRCYADIASAINNYKLLVGAPRRGQICFPYWESEDATTDEHVVAVWGPLYVPDGYSVLRFDINHRRSTGPANVSWTVYAGWVPYTGERKPFSSTVFTGPFDSKTITTSDGGWKWSTITNLVLDQSAVSQLVYFTVVAQNGDAFTRGEVSYFSVRAELR